MNDYERYEGLFEIEGEKICWVTAFRKGFKWRCKKTGICCKNQNVMLTNEEIERFPKEFIKEGEIKGNKVFYLKFINEICPFLKQGNICTIYNNRPIKCRHFPLNAGFGWDNKIIIYFVPQCCNVFLDDKDAPEIDKKILEQVAIETCNFPAIKEERKIFSYIMNGTLMVAKSKNPDQYQDPDAIRILLHKFIDKAFEILQSLPSKNEKTLVEIFSKFLAGWISFIANKENKIGINKENVDKIFGNIIELMDSKKCIVSDFEIYDKLVESRYDLLGIEKRDGGYFNYKLKKDKGRKFSVHHYYSGKEEVIKIKRLPDFPEGEALDELKEVMHELIERPSFQYAVIDEFLQILGDTSSFNLTLYYPLIEISLDKAILTYQIFRALCYLTAIKNHNNQIKFEDIREALVILEYLFNDVDKWAVKRTYDRIFESISQQHRELLK
jgi:Fe-S-cluster containining protein